MFSDHSGIRNKQKHKAHSAHTGNQKRFGNLKAFKCVWSKKNLGGKLANVSNWMMVKYNIKVYGI